MVFEELSSGRAENRSVWCSLHQQTAVLVYVQAPCLLAPAAETGMWMYFSAKFLGGSKQMGVNILELLIITLGSQQASHS
jgi:hypothetical protein